nr:hypothetical protein CFP56_25974 [Quercus suber]
MQTIWNRIVLKSGFCGCPQCVQSVQAVSRRATTTATRRPRYPTSSTLWYSGVFAAAATYDASVKKQRREQWDAAIADVKEELSQSADCLPNPSEEQPTAQCSPLSATVTDVVDLFEDVEPLNRTPHWPVNTGSEYIRRHLPPESLYASDEFKRRADDARWVPKKMERAHLSMDILQLVMWREVRKMKGYTLASSELPDSYQQLMPKSYKSADEALQSKLAHLDYLRTIEGLDGYARDQYDVALCSYEQDEHGSYHDEARQLNHTLRSLFIAHQRKHITMESLLAQVAYNIHKSTAPPNLSTYNTLLLGFESADHRTVVGAVVASLRDVGARPNEITHACILRHYVATNNAYNFSEWVARMRGRNGGVTLARPDIKITDASRGRLIRQEENPDKIMQLPYPTPRVFAAIVEGTLKFAGFDTALKICEGMGEDGWGLCMSGMTPLLRDRADEKDWDSGWAVWREIETLNARASSHNTHLVSNDEVIGLNTFAAMLRLCSQCDRKGMFDQIWRVAIRTHLQCEKQLIGLMKMQQQAYLQKVKDWDDDPPSSDEYLRLANRPKLMSEEGEIGDVNQELSELHVWRLSVRDSVMGALQDQESEEHQCFYRLDLNNQSSIDHIEDEDAPPPDLRPSSLEMSPPHEIMLPTDSHQLVDSFDQVRTPLRESQLLHIDDEERAGSLDDALRAERVEDHDIRAKDNVSIL